MSAAAPTNRAVAQRPHVLIVSDDLGLRQFLAEGLLYAGFWTSAIASALQVLEVFRLRTFDLVLVDAELHGLDALELVRRLRGRSARTAGAPRTDVPILFVAGAPGAVDPDAAEAAGADDVLVPPLELEELGPHLHAIVLRWRTEHPDRPYADSLAAARTEPREGP